MKIGRFTRRTWRSGAVLGAAAAASLLLAPSAVAAPAVTSTVVSGVVRGDGQPLRNVSVYALDLDSPSPFPSVVAIATTGRDGSYRMTVDHSATTRIAVQFSPVNAVGGTSPTGYADQCYAAGSVCTAGDPTIDISDLRSVRAGAVLQRAGVIRGRVTDSLGRGVGSLPVNGYRAAGAGKVPVRGPDLTAVTDLNGNYTIARVNPGGYSLDFGLPGERPVAATPAPYGYSGQTTTTTVPTGRTVVVDQTVVGGGAITGTVVNGSGAPVPGALVLIDHVWPSSQFPSVFADSHGAFRIAQLPVGTVPVCASADPNHFCAGDPGETTVRIREFRATPVTLVVASS